MARFKELRIQKGLTQEELITQFNDRYGKRYGASSISMFENDKRIPETQSLMDFADFFNVSVDYLLGRTDEPGGAAGFQKGRLGDSNGESPLAQKAREAMATQEARNTNPELASITSAELALIQAYRNASGDIKRVVSGALQPRKVVSPNEQYHQIDEFFQLCDVDFYYARCDHDGMTAGDYVLLSKYPINEVDGKASIEDALTPIHTSPISLLYEELFPAMTSTGAEREKLLQNFINETFAFEIAYETGTPYISENITMGLPQKAAEKHFQKRIAELTAEQAAEEADNKPKPTNPKRA